ncbi:MAG TPA: thiamine pyrophosphate-dependent enzyme [Methanothrix sp.]|nr:thiamine pyrophosphate-dependent enzyme [Methanothrix sp.]
MKGLDAVKRAVEDAGVKIITCVPGYPITETADAVGAEISVNEKVALEIALGASATGAQAMVLTKQLGMNLLADPLVISATHTIGSGLVVLVGDDIGPKGSQAEMDSRAFGPLAELPVLDPRDPAALYASIIEAYQVSESLRIPAIVRVTPRLLSATGADVSPVPSRGSGQEYERISWNLTVKGRHQRHHREVLPSAEAASEATPLNRVLISPEAKTGIIASGFPASLAEGLGASILAVAYAHPLPWKLIRSFIDDHSRVLVAEEPEPFIESQLRMEPKVRGKLSGRLPLGLLERSDLVRALGSLENEPETRPRISEAGSSYESIAGRGYTGICDDCPFMPLYRALAKVDAPVAGDAGCAIRATREPYESVDLVYGLGSAVGVASGFRRRGIAVIGDFGLAHSGLQGLINAAWRKQEVYVVLLKNGVAAMTGGQEAPDLTRLVEALAPTSYISLPAPESEIEKALRAGLERPGVSVLVVEGRCARADAGRGD